MPAMSVSEQDRILCPVTEWQKSVSTRGRGVGTEMVTRYVIYANRYNWTLGLERQGVGLMANGSKYFPGFRLLLDWVKEMTGEEPLDVVPVIITSLEKSLGKDVEIDLSQDLEGIGKAIDYGFSVNFCVHDNVFGRVFKGDVEEEPKVDGRKKRKSKKKKVDKLAEYYADTSPNNEETPVTEV